MNNDSSVMTQALPAGFERESAEGVKYASAAAPRAQMQQVNLRGSGRGGKNMGQVVEKPKDTAKTLARLFKYFTDSKALLVLMLVAVCLVTGASLAAPALQGKGIDLIKTGGWDRLVNVLIMLVIVYVLRALCTLAQTLISARLSATVVRSMRHDLFNKIDRLPIAYLDTHSSGDVMSRMTNDVENISSTVSQSLSSLISGVLTITGTVAVMFWYCWQLTLITMITVVITIVFTKTISKVMRKVYRKRSEVLGGLNGHSEEMISSYKSVVAYNCQDEACAEFDVLADELKTTGFKAEVLAGSMGPVMNTINNAGFVLVAAFGGFFALRGMITIGVISAFIIYAKQFSRPLNEIAQLYGTIQTAIAGAERVFELMDQPDEDKSGTIVPEDIRGKISFRHVNFSYNPEKQVLFDFNLDVEPGQKIALVGSTGSGKTTVVNLLMRFYPLDSGEILIDGININELDRDCLRREISIVLQDTVLFSDTVENNIRYSNREAPDSRVRQVARVSNCHNFIRRLPEMYKTFLRQAGENLSQGQRQLIAIARALMPDPAILILDEATSSVDTRTEKNIQDALVNLMKNRTSLIIAHRLSTIQDADLIVVMDKGRVVETGNHEQLLEKQGFYYKLYMTQFAGEQT